MLRNQHFEVILSEASGGIADVRFHGQRANRVSQQVALRYETPRRIPETVESEERTTFYATTRCDELIVRESGPWRGEIESRCRIVDAASGEVLWRFR